MNCLSNCPWSAAVGGGVAARMAWNSLIAGFDEASVPDPNRAHLIDCAITEKLEASPSLCREPGTTTTKNSATKAETPTAAAKRAATIHSAFFESRSGSRITSGSRGWRSASDTAFSSWEAKEAVRTGRNDVPELASRIEADLSLNHRCH